MVTSTVYPARSSQKIIKEFRTRKNYNKSHHFTAGVYFFLPNQSKREDWWCALEENCTIWNGPRRYKFASNCVFSRHDGSSKMFWKASVSEIGGRYLCQPLLYPCFFIKSFLVLQDYIFLLFQTFELIYKVYEKVFFPVLHFYCLCRNIRKGTTGVVFIVICILKYFQEETLGFQEED